MTLVKLESNQIIINQLSLDRAFNCESSYATFIKCAVHLGHVAIIEKFSIIATLPCCLVSYN